MDNKLTAHIDINRICMVTVKMTGGVLIFYLLLLSIFSTSVRSLRNYGTVETPEWGRYTYFLSDSPVKNILIIIILTAVLWGIEKVRKRKSSCNNLLRKISPEVICGVYFLAVILYILSTQFLPKSDPAELLRIADEILNRDFHEFEKEGYMYRYPYQSGFVFLCMAAVKIFGAHAYLFLQVVNAISVTMFFYLLGKLAMLWWGYSKAQVACLTLINMVASLPLFIYVSFVYGNLPGMALSTAAIYFLQRFLNERKISRLTEAALSISVAVVLKSNCLILFVAMLIALFWDGLKDGIRKKTFPLVLCILVCFIMINQGVTFAMKAITGQEISKGMPKSALIAMGLEEGAAGPGTENGSSNRIYEENNYQFERADSAAKEQIKANLAGYIKNPTALISFFARKQALQYNEPTFQCFSISSDRDTDITVPKWLNSAIAGRGSLYLAEIMNIMHAVILFGACVYVFAIDVKRPGLDELIFVIIFIGCFLFQMFYEAKSQYILIFFFMLLPYMTRGYHILLMSIKGLEEIENRKALSSFVNRYKARIGIVAAVAGLLVIIGIWTELFSHTICLRSSNELLKEYYEVIHTRENPNG